ncbi:serine hydrolase domain-containing protein [Microbacterium sp. CFBP9034]|uniref:serine hydrolase domain-containing protein n=1 Tax=Microbacterium sp. CFBP9034 TaxID=3096540 RepID=UPI002A69CBB2|nr:serine hydrolase domain-containing protein [Microbacterium sp. CFBP9034]MDY0908177.1 serine hydrolase domain-containing protein [Microbacterium sp. CFBP9034]
MAATAAVAMVLALAACSPAPQVELDVPAQADVALPDESAQQLQDAVTHAMAASGSSGAIVGVWAPWSGSWVAGLGTQYPGSAAEVTADMQFRAGQITRAMICDVLYSVAAEGTVRLDDKVPQYVASVPDLTEVTLEQLCDGTSGIGAYGPHLLRSWISNPDRTWSPRELASYGLGEARTEPGAEYRDSDAGYVLLGLAMERATGRSAADLIEEYVAAPLDLPATTLGQPDSSAMLEGLFSRKLKDGSRNCAEPLDVSGVSPSSAFTDSGVVSDIDDLGRYAQALAAGALHPGLDDRFDDPKAVRRGGPSWYTAAGGAVQAGSLIGQLGMVPGYISAAFSDPDTGLTVAVVLNNSTAGAGIAGDLAWELAAIASKAPAAAGETAPEAGLPWTAEQYHTEIAGRAICPPPA